MNSDVVLKLGGSLIDCVSNLINKINEHAKKENRSVLIVPGGAVFANNIRTFQATAGISDEAAHWMAVLAMEQYAYYLADRTGISFSEDLESKNTGVNILLPYQLLHKINSGLDHSWDVTSDTISAWVARKSGRSLIKVTDVDGIYIDGDLLSQVNAADLIDRDATCVDKGLPSFLVEHNMDCMVVNGKYPSRVLAAMDGDTTVGTLISG